MGSLPSESFSEYAFTSVPNFLLCSDFRFSYLFERSVVVCFLLLLLFFVCLFVAFFSPVDGTNFIVLL